MIKDKDIVILGPSAASLSASATASPDTTGLSWEPSSTAGHRSGHSGTILAARADD